MRKVLETNGLGLTDTFPHFYEPIGETLLKPTRIYVRSILGLLEQGVPVRGMAHITGGGIAGNLSRVIPEGLSARIHLNNWKQPPVFRTLQALGNIADDDMLATFNMGVGFILVVPEPFEPVAARLLGESGEKVLRLGEIVRGDEKVTLGGLL